MNDETSRQMLDMVSRVRDRAARAESQYDRAADEVQRMASRSIDLFGGTATSQVADIASAAQMACDRLYAEYQALVQLLDEECRPLLEQGASLQAVREVSRLIAWLNEESKIENNFTASFNSRSLGDVASRRYMPSVGALAIQSFWEMKYDMFPGRREEEARVRAAQQEAQAQAQAERREREEQERRKYEQEHAEWQTQHDRIAEQRRAAVQTRMIAEKKAILDAIEQEYEAATADANARAAEYHVRKDGEERKLAGLGFFAFGAKKQCRLAIEQYAQLIDKAQGDYYAAQSRYAQNKQGLEARLQARSREVEQEVARLYPMPPEPRKAVSTAGMTAVQMANESIKGEILDTLSDGKLRTVPEIMEDCPACSDLSNQRVSALVRQLVNEGRVERIEEKRLAYFRIVPGAAATRPAAATSARPTPSSGMSAMAMANASVKEKMLDYMRGRGVSTVSDLVSGCPACSDLTNQRVSALLRQLVEEGRIERFEENRKAYFRVAD